LTTTISDVSPEIVGPDFVIWLETITAMYAGTLLGGGVLLPGRVVQVPPQAVGIVPRVANPLKESGAAPPERWFKVDHWAPHHVTVVGAAFASAALTVWSPSTNAPPIG